MKRRPKLYFLTLLHASKFALKNLEEVCLPDFKARGIVSSVPSAIEQLQTAIKNYDGWK